MEITEEIHARSFYNDITSIASTVSASIQLVLGISYMVGKYLAETIVSGFEFIVFSCIQLQLFVEALVGAIVDIWSGVFHGVLLVYYGIGKIIEAFQLTFLDLISLLTNMYTYFSQIFVSTANLIINSLSMLTIIPSQLNTTLALVGDFVITILWEVGYVVQHFLTSLIWSPVYALSVIFKVILVICVQIPKAIISSSVNKITLSAVIGLCVIIFFGYIYSRLSFLQLLARISQYSVIAYRTGVSAVVRTFRKIAAQVRKKRLEIQNNNAGEEDENDGDTDPSKLKGVCVVCQIEPVCFISLPCNHVCLCLECVHRLVEYDNRCPMCRKVVEYFQRVYIS